MVTVSGTGSRDSTSSPLQGAKMEPEFNPSGSRTPELGRVRTRRLFLLAGMGAVSGAAVLTVALSPRTVVASPVPSCPVDQNCDGLPDILELQYGSSPTSPDTDGDGGAGLEECIRRLPPTSNVAIGDQAPSPKARVFAYTETVDPVPKVRIGVSLYSPNGNPAWLSQLVMVGMLENGGAGVPVDLRMLAFQDPQGVEFYPGFDPGSLIARFSFSLPISTLDDFVPFSFGAGSLDGNGPALDSISLDLVGGYLGYYTLTPLQTPPGGYGSAAQAAFTPLDPGATAWGNFGNACVLTMQSGGSASPYVLVEVTGASCSAYPSYCDAGACTAKLGTVHHVLDVLGLIGGG